MGGPSFYRDRPAATSAAGRVVREGRNNNRAETTRWPRPVRRGMLSPVACEYRETALAKQSLRKLDTVALAVALDRAEDAGLTTQAPSPAERPADCVYLKYVGTEQLDVLTRRLPHATILL